MSAIAAIPSESPAIQANTQESGCCGSGRFGQVTVRKIGPDNDYIRDNNRVPREWLYIEDRQTGKLYLNEERVVVGTKEVLLILGSPVYTAGKMIGNFVKIFLDIARIGKNIITQFGVEWKAKGISGALKFTFTQSFYVAPKNVGKDIWNIVSAPFFATALVLSCAYGLLSLSPYAGRVAVAKVDNAWQGGLSRKDDIGWCSIISCQGPDGGFDKKSLDGKLHHTPIHYALCFQVQYDLKNNHGHNRIEVVRRCPLSQAVFPI